MPEGLGPSEHLDVALTLTHPFLWPVPLSASCQIALQTQSPSLKHLGSLRKQILLAVVKLGKCLRDETNIFQAYVHKFVRPVSQPLNIALFLRELAFIAGFKDPQL